MRRLFLPPTSFELGCLDDAISIQGLFFYAGNDYSSIVWSWQQQHYPLPEIFSLFKEKGWEGKEKEKEKKDIRTRKKRRRTAKRHSGRARNQSAP